MVFPRFGGADGIEVCPEVGRDRVVGEVGHHPRLLAVLDFPERVAAELTVVTLLVDAEAALSLDQHPVLYVRDHLIDGRGSYSIDQQRYNGQFGGNCFWEIKNGKKTRMVTDVTYNAITTDFWGNLDAISGQESWRMYGTGGDAKGQPTQTNSISHGSPWVRIKKIMVGAAYA